MSSFDDFLSLGAPAQGAWNDIQSSLKLEGAADVEVQRAKLILGDQAMGLLRMVQNDTMQAIGSAHDYVKVGDTLAGTMANVESLVGAVSSGNVGQTVQITTGLLIGVATAAGVVTAGVGAAVIGVVGALSSILAQSNQYQYAVAECPGYGYSFKPRYMIGCLPGFGSPNVPPPVATAPLMQSAKGPIKDPAWLTFSSVVKTNTLWQKRVKDYSSNHKNIQFPDDVLSANPLMIDIAFPGYSQIIKGPIVPGASVDLTRFLNMFRSTWMANKERICNGHTGSSDAEVLAHAVRTWNRCHVTTGPTYILDANKVSAIPIAGAARDAKNLQPIDVGGPTQLILYMKQRTPAPIVKVSVPLKLTSKPKYFVPTALDAQIKAPAFHALINPTPAKPPADHSRIAIMAGGAVAGFAVAGPIGSVIGAGIGWATGKLLNK